MHTTPRPLLSRALHASLLCALLGPVLLLAACASAPDEESVSERVAVSAGAEAGAQEPQKPTEPEYVVVRRNARLYLRPEADAPFLQFRHEEAQAARDAARAEAREAYEQAEAERAEKRAEREAKRAERLKKRYRKRSAKQRKKMREREAERAKGRRRKEAERAIAHLDREARRWADEAPQQGLVVLRLLDREQGDEQAWLAARAVTPEEQDHHCYRGAAPRLAAMGLRVYVRAADVLPVTTRRVRVGLEQGAEMTLPTGVALLPIGEGRHRAIVDGFVIEAEVDPAALDTRFTPRSDKFEAPRTDTVFTSVALAEEKLKLTRKQALPHNPWHDLHVTATLWIGERFYVTTQTPCGEFTVRASEEDLEPVGRRGVQQVGGDDTPEIAAPYVRGGAALFDPTGQEIGRTTTDMTVDEAVDETDGRRCYQKAIWDGDDAQGSRQLVLCVDPEAVVTIMDAAK